MWKIEGVARSRCICERREKQTKDDDANARRDCRCSFSIPYRFREALHRRRLYFIYPNRLPNDYSFLASHRSPMHTHTHTLFTLVIFLRLLEPIDERSVRYIEPRSSFESLMKNTFVDPFHWNFISPRILQTVTKFASVYHAWKSSKRAAVNIASSKRKSCGVIVVGRFPTLLLED